MATSAPTTIGAYWTTDAGFRTIGSAIKASILAVNIVQTSDTGQINWTTVTKPSAGGVQAGYEIYRFADSLQSTSPVFIKIGYGSISSVNYLGLWLQTGTGSDGAGNLTGNVSPNFGLSCSNGNDGITARASFFSGDTNRLCAALFPNVASPSYNWMAFGLERTHDTAGADTGTGLHMFMTSPDYGGQCYYLPLGTTTAYLPSYITGGWYCSAPLTGNGALSPDIYTYPIKNYAPTETTPIFNFVHYLGSDITNSTTVSITGYDGTSRSYYATGIRNNTAGWLAFSGAQVGGINAGVGLLMRYD